jgi:riboflavin transporter FmnP
MEGERGSHRLDTVSVAGIAVFSALALVLGALSQSLGLNFPLIPYLQFDFGEVAIVLAFFIFGPVPASISSFAEFAGLMAFGQQVPVGPLLKLFALLSTVLGLWVGTKLASKVGAPGLSKLVGSGSLVAAVSRALVLTIPNFYLLQFYYSPAAIQGLVKYVLQPSFALVGITVTDANFLVPVLVFTAVFNVLQLSLVMAISYGVLRVPAMSQIKVGGRIPWFATVTKSGAAELSSAGES